MRRAILFALPLACAAAAPAATLRLCMDERPLLPYSTPRGDGLADQLILDAAKEVGLTVALHAAPLMRCREEIRVGAADAFPNAPNTPALQSFVAIPMRGAEPDTARAVLSARSMVFRRTGSAATWDGARFRQLSTPVLVRFGSVRMVDRLAALGVQADDSGKSLGANFTKLLAGRADLAVGQEYLARALLAQPEFAGKIEMLPLPFADEFYYLGLSKQFYAAHPQVSEQLWDAIGRRRKSPPYLKALGKALEEQAAAGRE